MSDSLGIVIPILFSFKFLVWKDCKKRETIKRCNIYIINFVNMFETFDDIELN